MEPVYEVVAPIGRAVRRSRSLAPRLSSLEGKTIGEVWDWLFRGDEIFRGLRVRLNERHKGIRIVPYDHFGRFDGPDQIERLAGLPAMLRSAGCDAVISGIGS